ncbi:Crp/Fnr family transcriptional regulator [Thiolapillus brandeum]|uniref:Crp/FNR family transcriptional regulator, anaerobic regulatory protein n=1 Tax=Thiolapillus brandeum TaxID=1076588 RepID=A0A7U6JJL4_9GAMM|nr:Crp/Fnr family transcriptional regulator [Thiolapillus brandeum]BAO45025.1 Crp/FNR family transcriptional regulator, anaerobic regulatory protein [Thiolapillus brandeum]
MKLEPEPFQSLFPELGDDEQLVEAVLSAGSQVQLPAGQHICMEGSTCSHLAFILSGRGRVYKLSETGREITLYRVEPGECCILTLSCIVSEKRFPAFAVSESDLQAIVVPAVSIQHWMDNNRTWRRYAWNLIAERLGEVISLVEEVTFRRMDERLAFYLNQPKLFPLQQPTRITHQQIAAELGTSREVISRLLKDLEEQRVVALGRGWLKVLKPPM